MENRIEINGICYIKEDTYKEEPALELREVFILLYEDSNVLLEANFTDETFTKIEFISYKDKHTKTSEIWDNNIWFDRIVDNEKDAILEIPKNTDIIIQFIKQILK